MNRFIIGLSWFFCIINSSLFAQEFECISTVSGLSNNYVHVVDQDTNGILWIGTHRGLNKYNGYDIKQYYHNPDDSNTILNNQISELYVTRENQLLVGTHNGLSVYNPTLDNFDRYFISPRPEAHFLQDYINDIKQDDEGNVWVATAAGLFRFDPSTGIFTDFFTYMVFLQVTESVINELKTENVPFYVIKKVETLHASFYDNVDRLSKVLLTILGEIDHKSYAKTIIQKLLSVENQFTVSSVNAFVVNNYNNYIWLGLSNGHIVRVHKTSGDYTVALLSSSVDIENNISQLVIDGDKLWVAAIAKSFILDMKTFEVIDPQSSDLKRILNSRELVLNNTPSNTLWIGTGEGLVLFDKKEATFNIIKRNNFVSQGYKVNSATHLFVGNQGHLWVSSKDNGVCKMIINKAFHNIVKSPTRLSEDLSNIVSSIMIDQPGNAWVSYMGGGIDIYNSKNELHQSFLHDSKTAGTLSPGTIIKIRQDQTGRIWVASDLGILQLYYKKENRFDNYKIPQATERNLHFIDLVCDKQNNLWINSLGDGLYCLKPDRKQIIHFSSRDSAYFADVGSDWVKGVFARPGGGVFISVGSRLYEFNYSEEKFDFLAHGDHQMDYLQKCMYEDNYGNVYIGTTTGLFVIVQNEEGLYSFSDSVYFSDFSIQNIISVDKGVFWISTDKGLIKTSVSAKGVVDERQAEYSLYQTGDGLPSNNFAKNACDKTEKGKILLGTDRGVVTFHPDSIRLNTLKPKIVFTDFKLFNESLQPGNNSLLKKHVNVVEKITLPHNQNFITIEFAALNYINPDANQYAYILEGVDNRWNHVGNKRVANYTKLRPGRYLFKIKASNNDNIWNKEGRKLMIEITPPFWATRWALLVYFVFLVTIILSLLYLIRYREKLKANQRLERLNMMKDNELNKMKLQFFTNISHEFRTPLTLILGPVESLIQTGAGNSEKIRLIHRNAKKLLKLIDQIMDIRKLSSGKMRMQEKLCNIVELVNQNVSEYEYHCLEKKITLYQHSNVRSINTFIDPEKFETILNNLLSNAVKNTPSAGEINVRLFLMEDSDNKLSAEFDSYFSVEVEDSGKGISKADQMHVFDRFYQANQYQQGGSGIGLALVKELVEIHKGRVTVESELGAGTRFKIIMPVSNEPINEKAGRGEPISIPDDEQLETVNQVNINLINESKEETIEQQMVDLEAALPLILVVEDNSEIRKYICSELTNDYRLIEAPDGKAAIDLALEKFPDIIISDIMMPEMNGIEMCKQLKNNEKTSHIPVILLTAYNDEKINVAGYETGADSYLVKPFSAMVLRTRIKNILHNRERLKEKFSNVLYSIPSNKSINSNDEQFLQRAIQIVENNIIEENFNIAFLCKEMGYSRTAFYSKVKGLTNQSISEFIKLIRLKKAIELFQNGETSVKEVAFLVGFKTHSHFSRCFSEEFKMSPSEYLDQINKSGST